jgi:SH3-like domain-containing protein
MKQCPVCKTTYTDESLKFCLADGANLISLSEPAETVQMSFDKNPMRINVPPDSAPTVFALPQTYNQPIKKGVTPIIVGVLVGLLLLAGIGFVGLIGYFSLKPTANENAAVSPTPAIKVTQTPTPDDETAELKEKLANLEKQVQDQKNQKTTTPVETYSTPPPTATTARANSPRDGFLALRSEPDSETGQRIAKIPHGANMTVLGCPKPSNIGKMRGHWCQVIYNGQSGWAFDAFMIF